MSRKLNLSLYRKVIILILLCGCTYYYGINDAAVHASAPCIQECETNLNYCNDTCDEDCREGSDDPTCYSCLRACSQTYFQCLSYAVSCEGLDVQPGRCEVGYTLHCPISGGVPDCGSANAHYGYSLTCELFSQTGVYCVSCPNGEYCTGSGGLPPCTGL